MTLKHAPAPARLDWDNCDGDSLSDVGNCEDPAAPPAAGTPPASGDGPPPPVAPPNTPAAGVTPPAATPASAGAVGGSDPTPTPTPAAKPPPVATKPPEQNADPDPAPTPAVPPDPAPDLAAEAEAKYAAMAAKIEALEASDGQRTAAMRHEVLGRLGVVEQYRSFAPDSDPFSETGRAELEKWAQDNPRLCETRERPAPGPSIEEWLKDKPGKSLVSPQHYMAGMAKIDRDIAEGKWD